MKFDWKALLFLFILATVLEFVLSGSNIAVLVGIEPLMIFFIAIIATKQSNLAVIMYIFFSILLDLILMQPVGMASLALFLAYLVTKIVNKVLNLMGEAKLLFNLIVIVLAVFFRQLINLIISGQNIDINFFSVIIISLLYSVLHGIINKVFSVNAYSR